MKIAIIGVTGMVGRTMLQVLKELNFPVTELIPVASEKSKGQIIDFGGLSFPIITIEEALNKEIDIALFSAGGTLSLKYAPLFAEKGIKVIDNSSAWRMDPNIKLIIPEVNGHELTKDDYIIANPNCSTIQLLMVLAPLHRKYQAKRVVVSTYQSVSGTGKEAVDQMHNEAKGIKDKMVYPYPIFENVIPHCDVFLDNDYTKEEMKMTNETKKILDPNIKLAATAVRVPTAGGHSESVNVTFEQDFDIREVQALLANTPGVILQDDPQTLKYPMPFTAFNKNEVFVGRIRRDFTLDNSLNFWVVADNLRKGAATNTVQIAQYLHQNKLI